MAQSREIFIGAAGPRFERRADTQPERTLEAASGELSRGNVIDARRLLESIIERWPDSRGADEARRLLAPIYAGNPDPLQGTRQRQDATTTHRAAPAPFDPPPAAQAPRRDPLEVTAVQQWGGATRQMQVLAHQFRIAAGDRVFFGDLSTEIGAKSRLVLQAQAQWLARFPTATIIVEGHADDRGTPEQNAELASRRAEAVRTRLVEEGVAEARIRTISHGRTRPVAPCSDPDCAAQNRRVVTAVRDAGNRPVSPVRNDPLPRASYGRGERN